MVILTIVLCGMAVSCFMSGIYEARHNNPIGGFIVAAIGVGCLAAIVMLAVSGVG